jgi:glycosyltransferase involved in cell wall biosynthesis
VSNHWQVYAIAVYFLIGPGMWLLAIIGLFQTHKRLHLIKQPRNPIPEPAPSVTILIPAKDEQERIGDCLLSALAQKYPNFRVIAVDDRSEDRTGVVMDELARRDTRLSVLHITELPEGWTGKCHALYQAAKRADGQWLLCIDSDVLLQPDALPATLGLAIKRKYGLVSLLPRIESHSLWEGMVVPLAGAALAALFTALWNNSNTRPAAFANGQFILFRRDAYDAAGGHEAVRDHYCEDMALARIFKAKDLRPRRGRSSVVERHVANVNVEGSNPFARLISSKTVDMHRQNIMQRLQLRSVAELTKYAIREGLTALHSGALTGQNGNGYGLSL